MTKVTRLNNGEVLVENAIPVDLRFKNQEEAHSWLARRGYKIVSRERHSENDHISGDYIKTAA